MVPWAGERRGPCASTGGTVALDTGARARRPRSKEPFAPTACADSTSKNIREVRIPRDKAATPATPIVYRTYPSTTPTRRYLDTQRDHRNMNMDASHEHGLAPGGESPISTTTNTAATVVMRRLVSNPPDGRAVLTVLYVCVLSLCFAVPLLYYCRMHWEERQVRRLRELELAGITQAMAQSQNQHRHESRAARRKFREERKARIRQLFGSVKMVRRCIHG